MKIVITAGHSNTDPGAVAGGQTEAKLMTQLRNLVATHLRALGHVVLTDGELDVNQPLTDALTIIKPFTCWLDFIHFNVCARQGSENHGGAKEVQ